MVQGLPKLGRLLVVELKKVKTSRVLFFGTRQAYKSLGPRLKTYQREGRLKEASTNWAYVRDNIPEADPTRDVKPEPVIERPPVASPFN